MSLKVVRFAFLGLSQIEHRTFLAFRPILVKFRIKKGTREKRELPYMTRRGTESFFATAIPPINHNVIIHHTKFAKKTIQQFDPRKNR
jgi:hypothetical protein